jgi:hypothetical protein
VRACENVSGISSGAANSSLYVIAAAKAETEFELLAEGGAVGQAKTIHVDDDYSAVGREENTLITFVSPCADM